MVSWGEFARFSPREGISRDSATDSKPVSGRAKGAQRLLLQSCANCGSGVGLGVSLSGARGTSAQPAQRSPAAAAAAAAAELSSSSAPSEFRVCLCVSSSRAERARLKGTHTPCRIRGAMGRDRRADEISATGTRAVLWGLGGRGAARARPAALARL